MSFSSDKNKGLLWNLMYEGGVFANIPNEAVSKVKELFENKISQLDSTPGSVLEKNKQAMMEMVKDVESLRTKPILSSSNAPQSRNYDTPVTSSDIQNQRREKFNTNLEKKQSEFTSMMTVKKPNKLDFSDSPDEKPIGDEMDKLLADMIAKRDLQLSNATANHNATAAQDWITKDNSNPESFTNTVTSSNAPTLQIGESLDISSVENIKIDVKDEIQNRKTVTFSDEKDSQIGGGLDFLSRFKKTTRDNSEIIEEIKTLRSEITSKLTKIDELLVELS